MEARPTPSSALRQAEDLRVLVLRALVLRYLVDHPDAMDTFDGIAEWWVTREQLRVDLERLAHVVDDLVRQGILEETTIGDRRFYRLRPGAPDGAQGGRA